MTDERDLAWYQLLLGWLEDGLLHTRADRLGVASVPMKLVRFHDSPGSGYTTWATFEHSDRRWRGPSTEVGYELLFTARGEVDGITVLRRVVETLTALHRPPQQGTVLLDLLQGVDGVAAPLRHAVLMVPWAWDDFEPLEYARRRVEPVAVVGITEPEADAIRVSGFDALARRWEIERARLLDPGRVSSL